MKNLYTFSEIKQQPALWHSIFELVKERKVEIRKFLQDYMTSHKSEVVFTGAGSSFFIGEMVSGPFQLSTKISSKAVSSTELVTHPELYINPQKDTLLVSFARSGDSPESVSAIVNAQQVSTKISNLIICCNKDGKLMKMKFGNSYRILLPEEANDKGLAMTSSVSSMVLTALLIARINEIEQLQQQIDLLALYANRVIQNAEAIFKDAVSCDFDRAVFLGSGAYQGLAREAHLKLQELTNGKLICKFDSFLGFRHGPKAIVNGKTFMVYFFSNDKYVRQYELDVVNSMNEKTSPVYSLGVSEDKINTDGLNQLITFSKDGETLDESFLMLAELVVAQLFGFYKSVNEGFNPDNPSINGAIHRVVQGVKIYNLPKANFEYSTTSKV